MDEDVGEATLSVHALEGSFGVDTNRIMECHKDRQLVILVESGSTTSFLHTRVAMELKLDVVKLPLSAVTV